MPRAVGVVLAAMLGLLAACEGESASVGRVAVRDSAGIKLVTNHPLVENADYAIEVFEIDLRIGVAAGDSALELGRISSVRVGNSGTIYAFDELVGTIRRFSNSGAAIGSIGQRGSGPGEFGPGTREFHVGNGDTLFVLDPRKRQLQVFTSAGDHVAAYDLPPILDGSYLEMQRGADSHFVFRLFSRAFDGLVVYRRGGTTLDTLTSLRPRGAFDVASATLILRPVPVWFARGTGEVVTGVTDSPRLTVMRSDGTTTMIIGLTLAEREGRISNADREALAALDAERQRSVVGRVVIQPTVADSWPLYARIAPGPDKTTLVLRFPPMDAIDPDIFTQLDYSGVSSRLWDVYDSEGRWSGVVELPKGVRLAYAWEDWLFGVETDELGVNAVVRLRRSQ